MNNDEKEEQGIISNLREKNKKANKSKFKMVLSKALSSLLAMPVAIKLITIVVIATCIWGAIQYIVDIEGSSNIVDVASYTVLSDTSDIVEAENGQGYYFRITRGY